MKRTQIYLAADQSRELAARAKRQGTTSSHIIREAVDEYLARPESDNERRLERYRAAIEGAFGIAPYLPDGASYVESLRAADTERARRIGKRQAEKHR